MDWLAAIFFFAIASAAAYFVLHYKRAIGAIKAQLARDTKVLQTSFAKLAYAEGGHGRPILSIHGAGGGHDQGALIARAFLPSGYRWIAPSRFGYLGSSVPERPSTAAQADAFAEFLDGIDIDQVSIIAMSGGAPPALQFALRHPNRVAALILLSLAPYAPLTAKEQALPVPIWLYDGLFATNFPLWAVLRLAPRAVAPIFDARPDLTARMTRDEAAFLDAMIAAFLPVTERRAGLANEGAATDPADPIDPAAIRAPVLIVHAADDRLAPIAAARFTAEKIPGAKTVFFGSGGHLLLGQHAAVRHQIAEFLSKHGPAS